jgi:hypothetical protein
MLPSAMGTARKIYDHRSAYAEQESTYLFFFAVRSAAAASRSAVAFFSRSTALSYRLTSRKQSAVRNI